MKINDYLLVICAFHKEAMMTISCNPSKAPCHSDEKGKTFKEVFH